MVGDGHDMAPKDIFGEDEGADREQPIDLSSPVFDEIDVRRDRLFRRRTNVGFLIERGWMTPEESEAPLKKIDEEFAQLTAEEARLIFDPNALPDGPHTPYVDPKPKP